VIEEYEDLPPKIACGQTYRDTRDKGDLYILAHVEDEKVALISLNEGNRWDDPVEVGRFGDITPEEFDLICGNVKRGMFKCVKEYVIVRKEKE
jgi:hypothetical protein